MLRIDLMSVGWCYVSAGSLWLGCLILLFVGSVTCGGVSGTVGLFIWCYGRVCGVFIMV